jgi:HEAT repeat protein
MVETTDHEVMAVELDEGEPVGAVDLDVVRSGLESEQNMIRTHAANVALAVAKADDGRAVALSQALCEAVRDDHRVVVHRTVAALAVVADEAPDRVEPAVDRLVELLDYDVPSVGTSAGRALGALAVESPGALVDHVDALVAAAVTEPEDVVDPEAIADAEYDDQARTLNLYNASHVTEQAGARQVAANLLVTVADHDPTVVVPHVPELVDALSTNDATALTALVDALGSVAQAEAEAVRAAGAVDTLSELLDHPDETVVATAVTTLGYTGDPTVVDSLREVADDADRDADLREFAAETADVLATVDDA